MRLQDKFFKILKDNSEKIKLFSSVSDGINLKSLTVYFMTNDYIVINPHGKYFNLTYFNPYNRTFECLNFVSYTKENLNKVLIDSINGLRNKIISQENIRKIIKPKQKICAKSNKEKSLIEYCLYFSEKLQECIDTGNHPFGSGNAIKDVLLSFDDFYKKEIE